MSETDFFLQVLPTPSGKYLNSDLKWVLARLATSFIARFSQTLLTFDANSLCI
jgi:hypothetical protein